MSKKIYGYVRVSTQEQNEERQLVALKSFMIPTKNIFIEKCSGRHFKRTKYNSLIRRLREGDLLIIKSIDRLGRDYKEIKEQWRLITQEKGADIKVIDMPLLDTSYQKDLFGAFISDLVLQILSLFSQIEWENIKQRQAEGIAAAKARGVRFGRKSLQFPDNFDEIYKKWRVREYSTEKTATLCGFSRRTLFEKTKILRETEK